jgi:hypothetical protein
MKKLLALAMVVLLVLSIAVTAFGVEFSSSIGGRFYGYVSSIDGDRGFNPAPENDCWDTVLAGTIKGAHNTWAQISFIASTWEQTINHAFGMDNIAGSPWSIGFDTHDTGTTNLGQQYMGDLFNDFKADPLFNSCNMPGSFNFKYITDTFEYRGEAQVYDGNGSTKDDDQDFTERYANVIIFKTDYGKLYMGNQHKTEYQIKNSKGIVTDISKGGDFYIVGFDSKINDVDVKIDFWSDKDAINERGEFTRAFWGGQGHRSLQTTLNIAKITGQLLYSQPDNDDYDDVVGLGIQYQFTESLALGAKMFMVDEALNREIVGIDTENNYIYGTDSTDQYFDVYGLYNIGAWDLKFGVSNAQYLYGQAGPYNAHNDQNYPDTKAHYADDPFFYVGVHFEF